MKLYDQSLPASHRENGVSTCTLRAPSSDSYSSGSKNFRSNHRVLLCCLLACTMIGVCFQHSNECDRPQVTAGEISRQRQSFPITNRSPLLVWKVLFGTHQSFAPSLRFSLWAKHGRHSSSFSGIILILTCSLADAGGVIGTPEPSIAIHFHFLHTAK